MRADLHCHSHYSDGAHSPTELLERALVNGLSHFSITDHDCIDACTELAGRPDAQQLLFIPGVEISCQSGAQEIHVLGLGIDLGDAALNDLLARQQQRRRDRIRTIGQRLAALGIDGLADYLAPLPTRAPGRTQAADFLISKGLCRDRQRAFRHFLGRRGRCHVPSDWCSVPDAIRVILGAGGIPVLAHPHRYASSTSALRRLIKEFKLHGGLAMEVACGNLDRNMLDKLGRLCQEIDLLASSGSDFHSAAATWTDLGRVPELPAALIKNAIWAEPRWHSWSPQTGS